LEQWLDVFVVHHHFGFRLLQSYLDPDRPDLAMHGHGHGNRELQFSRHLGRKRGDD